MATYNASDTKHIRRQVKVAKAVEERTVRVISGILSTPDGRHWLSDLFETCHLFSTSFSPDALAMAFAEGERNVGIQIFNIAFTHCTDQCLQMTREAYGRRTSTDNGRGGPDPNTGRYPVEPDDSPAFADGVDYDPTAAED